MSAGLAIYACLIMAWDPFPDASSEVDLFVGCAVCLIPLLCLKGLVRSRSWFAVCGAVLFAATCIACLFYNFPAMRGGWGFHYLWIY
jgi:hypothetical protein